MMGNVHIARIDVKAKCTHEPCFTHFMAFDDRPDYAKRLQLAREHAKFPTARAAAIRFGWSYDTYLQHENGTRGIQRAADRYAKAYKVSKGWLLTGEGHGPGDPSSRFKDNEERLRHLEPEGFAELQDTYEVLLKDKLEKAERKRQQ